MDMDLLDWCPQCLATIDSVISMLEYVDQYLRLYSVIHMHVMEHTQTHTRIHTDVKEGGKVNYM